MYVEREKPPEVFDKAGVIAVAATYASIIALAWCLKTFAHETKEDVIPIDMTIVINENLDGEENEPPPEAPPQTPPDEQQPEIPKYPAQPPPKVQDAVIHEQPKKQEEKKVKKEPEKKPPEKGPDAKERRRQRLEEMRKSVKKNVSPPPKHNGRTEQAPPNLAKLLNDPAFKPGAKNQGLDARDRKSVV